MQVESTSKLMFTVNEANEDTISAFEDLEGFFVQTKFRVREMGY